MLAEAYGLSGEPFLLTPDPRFFFESDVHKQAMSHLLFGLAQGEGFITIVGDVGAGKTTLVEYLLSTLDRERIVPAHVTTTLVAGADLMRMVASAFGIQTAETSKSGLLLVLEAFFRQLVQEDRRGLLIVDEAQNLSVDALEDLRMLSNVHQHGRAPLQSFLLGQPQFQGILDKPALQQLRQRVIASYVLGPLGPEDCAAYIRHRLGLVGWTGDPGFEEDALTAIHAATDGVPRRVNALCNRLMLFGVLEDVHVFGAAHVQQVAAEMGGDGGVGGPEPKAAAVPSIAVPRPRLAPRLTAIEQRLDVLEKTFRNASQLAYLYVQKRGEGE